jgi:hypothetical protein
MSQSNLRVFLKNQIARKSKKLKGKFAPFSDVINNEIKVLKIKAIYDLRDVSKNFYLFIVRNYSKHPKERYFLAIILASQSSDLLVSLANEFAQKNGLKLVQYAIKPKQLRISLISLKEVKKIEDYSLTLAILNEFRTNFRNILRKIKNCVE